MIRQRITSGITATAITLLLTASSALAADGRTPGAAYGGFWVALAIAYLTRRRKIGGWLFCYYFQAYAGFAIFFLVLALSLQNYQPSAWEDKALYTLFITSTLPSYLLKLLEATFASLLLFKRYRTQQVINYLKYILITEVVIQGMTLFIDYYHFPDNVALTMMGGILALVWYSYFNSSFRVYCVLSHPDWHWNYEEFKKSKSQSKRFNKAS